MNLKDWFQNRKEEQLAARPNEVAAIDDAVADAVLERDPPPPAGLVRDCPG